MIKYYNIQDHHLVDCDQSAATLLVAIAPAGLERTLLQDLFRLDDYDLSSMLDPDEVPRVDVAGDRLLLIWKSPETVRVTESIDLGVTVTGWTLTRDQLALVRATGDVVFSDREFRNIADIRDLLLAYLLRTVRHFVGHLRVMKQLSSELEKKITVSMENRHLLQMFALSESLVYYMDAIEGNAAALAKLRATARVHGFEPSQLEILDDIILENSQASGQARIYHSILSGLMDARGTIVNNNMNVLLRNLTLINIVFMPLNLIAGIGGMSEWTMMTRGFDWRLAYGLFCIGIVIFGWGTWWTMKKVVERTPRD
jgi:magnesium transporter